MAFKGMDPDEGRQVASEIQQTGEKILGFFDQATSIVTSVEWIGPDYDAYAEDWNGFISGALTGLADALTAKGNELQTHAEQQDSTSNAV